MQISGAPKHPTPEQLKTAQPQGERRPTWTLTAGFAYDLVRVAGGGASTALHRGGSRSHLVRRKSYRPGRLTAHLTQGGLCLGVGATLREDTPILSPDARPHRPRLYLNLRPPPPRPGERAAPFVFANILAGVFACAFAGVFAGVFVDLDLIKHPKVHSKYIIKSIPSQTCICARLSGAVGVSVCL